MAKPMPKDTDIMKFTLRLNKSKWLYLKKIRAHYKTTGNDFINELIEDHQKKFAKIVDIV